MDGGSWTGCSNNLYCSSDPERQREPIVKILDPLLKWLILGIRRLSESREQRKRVEEHTTKSRKALRENLGERLEQMMEVSWLITAPEYRKGGYATALVHVATDLADARGVSVWLASSNPVNEGFYIDLGFQTVGTFHLGTDNPSWKGPPVSIEIRAEETEGHDERETGRVDLGLCMILRLRARDISSMVSYAHNTQQKRF
ncbi:uncharacterized protein PHACADRAFT_186889 [Phanerochaete carnosa HHB-10118-sp]|uniref:N-acetyltransferase domain-containing protein n=1 Tax=Phanerochaete carnosa (strain HHB-10118-sp) TaxID=650164 RepID=K5WR63_PHACS|nr:uncharacterized protein PHACADRAFT_186889 [Phanerochaete carnosa HHB-10118-sp]EKM52832.1 hypothetical protein PHACADRAFT_186889 [Phanerochaete carnosa HHB-10118-sp]